eukprot:CAMPEP_0185022730 /NCGR_PEP_ID=MMETSP1103-20130426/5431_1 /TAXON_ID=36769 /ORGANISM="Paraphysomonas bandaiensis, Strain Caron Lab Isolate" /LENGTH=1307 /DNA_ID=CAMNT_0027554945 /DNA_START=376 /DNA_END=4299 /DNA_ORIENTATION=+
MHGEFEGHISLMGEGASRGISATTAFIPHHATKLYTPGLTYIEMLTYAARLRIGRNKGRKGFTDSDGDGAVKRRVERVLDLMGLSWCRDRVITERPASRGVRGGELRRLAIATGIIDLPPVIILDDPFEGLDPAVSLHLMRQLVHLSEQGHTVICTSPKPPVTVYSLAHNVVFIADGYSIFAGARDSVEHFFCSPMMEYTLNKNSTVVDFLFDIADGTERPEGQRRPLQPDVIQGLFESSPYWRGGVDTSCAYQPPSISILPDTYVPYYGYLSQSQDSSTSDGIGEILRKTNIVIERAFYVKFREREVLLRSLKTSVIFGLILGYFLWGLGADFDYTMNMLLIAYAEVMTVTSHLWIIVSAAFSQQIINVHILCQKIQMYRHENAVSCCPPIAFWFATLISEVPFALFFALLQSNIVYFMGELGVGYGNYFFFMSVIALTAIVGLTTAVMFATIIQRELVVRDLFIFCSFMMTVSSGYLFHYDSMEGSINKISLINFMRWAFEALMVWKYDKYGDGDEYLEIYSFQNFERNSVFQIMAIFIFVDVFLFFIGLHHRPNTLHRRVKKRSVLVSDQERASSISVEGDSTSSTHFSRNTDPVEPKIFLKQSSISSASSYKTSQPSTNMDGKGDTKGPTLSFSDLTFSVPDKRSPMGCRSILHPMSGRFDWGRLSVIMGSAGDGKSSLLYILAGEMRDSSSTHIKGSVMYDNSPISHTIPAWQRGGFVEAGDVHFRDLSVSEVVTFAMQLRSSGRMAKKAIAENVDRALELVQLQDFVGVKTKELSRGVLRRLSIAEEIVHGPSLVLIDEPITNLDQRETSIIVTGVLRELVNQDRTVVVTMHQPSAAVFEVVDTLLLLSRGRMIYMGRADMAASYFMNSRILGLSMQGYTNPADFLCDLSGCLLKNDKGVFVDTLTLASHYEQSHRDPVYSNALSPIVSLNNTMEEESESSESCGSASVGHVKRLSTGSEGSASSASSKLPVSCDVMPEDESMFRKVRTSMSDAYVVVSEWIVGVRNADPSRQIHCGRVILQRSWKVLYKRDKLVIGTTLTSVFFACVFGFMLGPSTNEADAVACMFGIGSMCILLSNLQFVFFMFNNHKVFLREHSRGLYSNLLHWLVSDTPVMVLRTVQSCLYGVIIHNWLHLKGGAAAGFYYLNNWIMSIVSTQLVETIVYILPDVRSAYRIVPAVGFLLFYFSGIMVKPSVLPEWLQPWLPSVSIIRWLTQALLINEYQYNREAFPEMGPYDYSTYDFTLSLYGWGGKTKWDCFYVLLINLAIYRIVYLMVSVYHTTFQKGRRSNRQEYNVVAAGDA